MSDSVRPHRWQPTGSPVPGILQARTLEWVAISFSNAWKWKVKVKSLSCVWLWRPHGLQPTRLLCPWDFPGKSIGVGCHCLLSSKVFTKGGGFNSKSLPHITVGWRSQFLTMELFLGLFTTWQLISAEQGIPEKKREKQKPLHLGSNILCTLQFLLQLAWVWLNFTSSGYSLVQGCLQLQTPDHLHFCSDGYKFEASYYPLKYNNSLQCFTEPCKALYL